MILSSLGSNQISATDPPIARIESGAVIELRTLDAYNERDVTPEAVLEPTFFPGKLPVTGPIEVVGARPGGWVAVTLHELESAPTGTLIMRKGLGLLGRTWDGPPTPFRFTVAEGRATNEQLGSFDAHPMIGSIAVAPADGRPVWSGLAGEHVGNFDCPEFGQGATMCLPVFQPGALIYLSDGHARMGHGELGGTGIEAGMLVRLSATPVDGPEHSVSGTSPLLLAADGWCAAIGRGDTVETAALTAIASVKCWLDFFGCDHIAARLSLHGEMRVCQVVNNQFTVAVGVEPHHQLTDRLERWRAGEIAP